MRIGVIQSNYIPWRGYFDFINSVDTFVIYDDVQYSKGTYRNRNQLKFESGLKWITVPVKFHLGDLINTVTITQGNWRELHKQQLTSSLGKTPFFADALTLWEEAVSGNVHLLTDLNEKLIRAICNYLEIKTNIIRSEPFELNGSKTERLMDLFSKVNATSYLSGQAADDYLDYDLFKKNNISLSYKSYNYTPYQQQGGEFSGNVSILDLIANTGKEAIKYIASSNPDKKFI